MNDSFMHISGLFLILFIDSGETTLSYFTQMIGLTVENFLSAAYGLGILFAVIRGLKRNTTNYLGNFWEDMI